METDQQVQTKLENRIHDLERKQEEDALRKKTEDDQLAVIEKIVPISREIHAGHYYSGNKYAAGGCR